MNSNLEGLIYAAERRLERINDSIDNLDDPRWVAERKSKLIDKRDATEEELRVLNAAQQQLRKMEGNAHD